MRNEFFIERYAHEKHQAHLCEAALERQSASSAKVRQLGRSTIRSQVATALSLIRALVRLPRQRVVAQVGRRVRTTMLAHGR
jgi:hypothetical protein